MFLLKDIAGADIVTDFGVICLLFDDPEQIFVECWYANSFYLLM
jgi:hypothetical protein